MKNVKLNRIFAFAEILYLCITGGRYSGARSFTFHGYCIANGQSNELSQLCQIE